MTAPRFKIVFNGELMPDTDPELVRSKLARLFNSDLARIEALFGGNTVIIKRNLPEDEADQYLAALHGAGAKASKEAELSSGLTLMEIEPEDTATLTCPKCAQEQPKSAICTACGLVFEKYQARQAEQPSVALDKTASTIPDNPPYPAEAQVAAPEQTPYAPPRASVADNLPAVGELKVFSVTGRIGRLRFLAWSALAIMAYLAVMAVVASVSSPQDVLGGLLVLVASIALLVVSVQMGVQRLHDMGLSGWLYLLYMIPLIGGLLWLLLMIVPGPSGANRYGPPPPANSTAVCVLAGLALLAAIGLVVFFILGGMALLSELGRL